MCKYYFNVYYYIKVIIAFTFTPYTQKIYGLVDKTNPYIFPFTTL